MTERVRQKSKKSSPARDWPSCATQAGSAIDSNELLSAADGDEICQSPRPATPAGQAGRGRYSAGRSVGVSVCDAQAMGLHGYGLKHEQSKPLVAPARGQDNSKHTPCAKAPEKTEKRGAPEGLLLERNFDGRSLAASR